MIRSADWEQKLFAAVAFNRNRPFEWGKHDCALFACNVIQDMTGTDLAASFRGRYSTALGAARAIRGFTNGGDLEALAAKICEQHNASEVDIKLARRGDVVIVESGDAQKALSIVGPDGSFALGAGPDGLTRIPLTQWKRAWRIG